MLKKKRTAKLNEGTPIEIQLPHEVQYTYQLPDPGLLDFYEDRNNRIIHMIGEVDSETYDWVDFILKCNREDIGLPIEKRKPIKCIIANVGGSAEAAQTIIEVISLSKTPVYGYAIGICASAASQIFLVCHKKFALPNATWLFHQGSIEGLSGTFAQVKAFMDDYEFEIQKLSEFYKTHTTFSPELIDTKLSQGDWYIHADEALENGVIDAVVDDIDMLL